MPDSFQLTPVDHDPFAEDSSPQLERIPPVDNPVAQQERAARGIASFLGDITGISDAARAWRGEMTDEEQRNFALTGAAGLLPIGKGIGAAAGAAHFLPAIFAGPAAKTADLAALKTAQQMAESGAAREAIWNTTGWFQGADRKWRFEIPDQQAGMIPIRDINFPHERAAIGDVRVGDVFQHPELFSAYPEMAQYRYGTDPGLMAKGSFRSDVMNPEVKHVAVQSMSPADQRSTMLHELQHGVQDIEGFARGSNPFGNAEVNPEWLAWKEGQSHPLIKEYNELHASPSYKSEILQSNALWREHFQPRLLQLDKKWIARDDAAGLEAKANTIKEIYDDFEQAIRGTQPTVDRADALAKQIGQAGLVTKEPPYLLSPGTTYRRAAGEVEARNVQTRAAWEQGLGEHLPWTTEDVPREQQIVRFHEPPGGIQKPYKLIPVDHDPFAETKRAAGGRVNAANINREPTEAQKQAGNYAKDHVSIHGLDITIENAKGHERRGVDKGGKAWSVKMPCAYGYLKRTLGKDGDHVDVYLGPHTKSPKVFVIDQKNADTGRFDEHKTFLAFASEQQVRACYAKAFSDGKAHLRLGHIEEMTIEQFKHWLDNGDTTKPIKSGEDKKLPHRAVGYVATSPHVGKYCGVCSMFVLDGPHCTLVADPVRAVGYCKRFFKGTPHAS